MIIKLSIKSIANEKEQIVSNYIKDIIDEFMDVVRTIDELEEYEEEENS